MSITKISPDVVDFDAGITISTTDNSNNLTLTSTDADGNAGPILDFYRNSSSPAVGDLLGRINFRGRNDNSQDVDYAAWHGRIFDETDGTEDGSLRADIMYNGTVYDVFTLYGNEVVVNESSNDIDFRVESNANANRFIIDAGTDKILIGNTTTRNLSGITSVLSVEGTGYNSSSLTLVANSADSNGAYVMIGKSRGSSVGSSTALQNGDQIGGLYFNAADGTDMNHTAARIDAIIYGDVGNNDVPGALRFFTTPDGSATATEKMRILPSGGITFNGDTSTANALDDYEEGTWTPSGSGTSFSQSMSGRYVKVGSLVHFTMYSGNQTLSSSSGTATITGLPFTAESYYTPVIFAHYNCFSDTDVNGYVQSAASAIFILGEGTVSVVNWVDGSGKYFMVSGCYTTAS